MHPNIYYQVGHACDPQPGDSEFLEYDAAEEDALLQSGEHDYVVAIWERERDTDSATTHRLVFQGTVWYPS